MFNRPRHTYTYRASFVQQALSNIILLTDYNQYMIDALHENDTLKFYYLAGRTLRILLVVPPASIDISGQYTNQ